PAMPTRLSIAPNAPIHQNSIHYGMIVKIFVYFHLSFSVTLCRVFTHPQGLMRAQSCYREKRPLTAGGS
ncbi:MAG: hypothetical protein JW849_09570, partial [Phycisphaerae bacterium]|nr:hypothetical protein [Phycisphaerae bacterium]